MKRIEWILLGGALLAAPVLAHEGHMHHAAAPHEETAPEVAVSPPAAPAPMPEMHSEHAPEPHPFHTTAPKPFLHRLLAWFGRMHPVVVHFPIAFLLGAAVAEFLSRRRPEFDAAARFLVVAGGLTAPLAAALGLIDSWGETFDGDLSGYFWGHRAFGILTALLALGAAYLRPRPPYRLLLGGAVVATILAGYLGACLTHGPEHLSF